MNQSFSQSCENNKQPILQIIKTIFLTPTTVWEIGSGTGQHACYFSQHLPHLNWQPTDKEENLEGINGWVEDTGLANVYKSLALNVTDKEWPCQSVDALFTANTLHIMHWYEVEHFYKVIRLQGNNLNNTTGSHTNSTAHFLLIIQHLHKSHLIWRYDNLYSRPLYLSL